jgi:hypothetical protein
MVSCGSRDSIRMSRSNSSMVAVGTSSSRWSGSSA